MERSVGKRTEEKVGKTYHFPKEETRIRCVGRAKGEQEKRFVVREGEKCKGAALVTESDLPIKESAEIKGAATLYEGGKKTGTKEG